MKVLLNERSRRRREGTVAESRLAGKSRVAQKQTKGRKVAVCMTLKRFLDVYYSDHFAQHNLSHPPDLLRLSSSHGMS